MAALALGVSCSGCGKETPEQAAERVRTALNDGGFSGITVGLRDGQPLLTGTVSSQDELDQINNLVGGLEGLPGFINEIQVVLPEPEISEEERLAQEKMKACTDALGAAVTGNLHFATSSAALNASAKEMLNAIASATSGCDAYSLQLDGYADPRGEEDYNQGLSERRAESARRYLVGEGVDEDRVNATGYGETRSLGGDLKDDRRVEISSGG